MRAYSPELRRDVLAASEAGASTHEVATEFNVSKSWVRRVKQEWREQGKAAPKATRDRPKAWERHAGWIRAKVEARPDVYLRELQAAAEAELGWTTCDMTFTRALRALGLTRKKRP
jgi:transposase